MKRFCIIPAMLLLAAASVCTAAEENIEKNISTMDEVVVTATKTEEKRKDIPNSVVIKDSMDIEEAPAEGIGALLANETGIDWRTRGNYGGAAEEIHIRGMQGDETQVLVNGVSINSPSLGRADVSGVALNSIARIEVVKGAGSLLYGSGAMAGTVNMVTKRPERDNLAMKARLAYGRENTKRISVEQGQFVTSEVGYYLTANRFETDGHRDNSDATQNDASLNLVFEPTELLDVSLFGNFAHRKNGVPRIKPPAGTTDYFINGIQFYSSESASSINRGKADDGHAVVDIKYAPLTWLKGNLKTYSSLIDTEDVERFNADYFGDLAGEGRKTVVENSVMGVETAVEITPVASISVLLGADYKDHDWHTETVNLDDSGQEVPGADLNDAHIFTKGVMAEFQYRPMKQIKLVGGFRQENHSTFGHEDIPHYGIILNPTESTAIKMNRGKFFKAPTPNDLFWPETAFVRGNPNLKAQTGWHSDITVEQSVIEDKFFGSLSYFEWKVNDKISWAPNPDFGGKWTPSNLNESQGNGWEAGVEYNPVFSVSIVLSYTYTDAEEEVVPGQWRRAQYTSRDRYKAMLTLRNEHGSTLSVVGRYVSDREFFRTVYDTEPTDVLDSYYTADVRFMQRFGEQWLLSLDAVNLFDTEYETYVGSFVDATSTEKFGVYPGAERSIFISAAYEF